MRESESALYGRIVGQDEWPFELLTDFCAMCGKELPEDTSLVFCGPKCRKRHMELFCFFAVEERIEPGRHTTAVSKAVIKLRREIREAFGVGASDAAEEDELLPVSPGLFGDFEDVSPASAAFAVLHAPIATCAPWFISVSSGGFEAWMNGPEDPIYMLAANYEIFLRSYKTMYAGATEEVLRCWVEDDGAESWAELVAAIWEGFMLSLKSTKMRELLVKAVMKLGEEVIVHGGIEVSAPELFRNVIRNSSRKVLGTRVFEIPGGAEGSLPMPFGALLTVASKMKRDADEALGLKRQHQDDMRTIEKLRKRIEKLERQIAKDAERIEKTKAFEAVVKESEARQRRIDELSGLVESKNERIRALKAELSANAKEEGEDDEGSLVFVKTGSWNPKLGELAPFPTTLPQLLDRCETVFGDRIAVTDKARDGAAKFEGGEEAVAAAWRGIVALATIVWEKKFLEGEYDEKAIRDITGLQFAKSESNAVKSSSRLLAQRAVEHEGKRFAALAHISFGSRYGYLRIHYDFDEETKQVVLGHVGEHLENGTTRKVK